MLRGTDRHPALPRDVLLESTPCLVWRCGGPLGHATDGVGRRGVHHLLTHIDLFAGAGGLSTGLEMAGFSSLFANEISPSYAETLKNSHPGTEVETGDIREVDAGKICRRLSLAKGELDLLAGGPPCQGFSINAPKRSLEDERNHLFKDYLRFAEEFSPKLILIENVPGMISFERGQTVQEILAALRSLGYHADVRVLFAPHYGVPQARWRTIILANRIGVEPLELFPIPKHFAEGRANFTTTLFSRSVVLDLALVKATANRSFVTVGDAISDLPKIENGGGDELCDYLTGPQSDFQERLRSAGSKVSNHQCARLGKVNLDRLKHIPPGGSWRDIPHDLLPKGMKRARRSDHTKRYGRLHPEQLGSTILTKCDPHWGTYIHPNQDRVLSVREAARIQSFPDHVRFFGSLTEQYEQVGNAVPPLFACEIGLRLKESLGYRDEVIDNSGRQNSPWMSSQLSLAV